MCANPNFLASTTTPATTNPASQPFTADAIAELLLDGCLDERELRPVPRAVLAALPLTAAERQHNDVFALTSSHHSENTPDAKCVARLAVCRLVPQIQWGELATGANVIYTEVFHFNEEDRPGLADVPSLTSHIGTVRVSDEERELFYTTTWNGNDNSNRSLSYEFIYEIWEVVRFVPLTYAN